MYMISNCASLLQGRTGKRQLKVILRQDVIDFNRITYRVDIRVISQEIRIYFNGTGFAKVKSGLLGQSCFRPKTYRHYNDF